ncbi:MAG: hypothetical protein ACI8V8_002418 [Chitinophagales bacterium]|jgi:hypothetical protein
MKNIITLFSFILVITSCDVVEGPYEIDTGNIIPTDTNTFVKKILIEDFTGHRCKNCPNAARELETIHEVYGDQIIGMALHVTTGYARPSQIGSTEWNNEEYRYDFRTESGNAWYDFFDISNPGLPNGMVNRTGYPNNHKLGYSEWASKAAEELQKEIDFGITILTNFSGDEGIITINTDILNNISGSYNLVVCLTESNIINTQLDGSILKQDYIHNHVLRTTISENQLSSSSSYNSGDTISRPFSFNLNDLQQDNIDYSNNTAEAGNGNAAGWDSSNMSVIAYIYDNTTQEILQVEEAHLMTK